MAFLNSLALILCLQAVLAIISIPASHCNTIKSEDYQLIENICKRTPNYNVCIQYLKSSPESSSADVGGLALIIVNVIKAKATSILNKIHGLQRSATGSVKRALDSCAGDYNVILLRIIPEATQALQLGDPKFAEQAANNVAYGAKE